MRFVSLQVEHFKAITAAELTFAPGLNVLYGPNDLGKSTLGVALRAALLLQSTSSAADEFVSWRDPKKPHVTLTFLDDSGRYWRVEKRFGENDATLSSSKDGKDFTVEAHERHVDDRLRKLLGWGIASPGGKGGPRGMPESFLANALLAAQTNVDGILRATLESDSDPAGKLRLTAALSALAQDPVVRAVLDRAQKEKDTFFTATGKKRTGQNSKLTRASDEVKALEAELALKRQALDRSATAEQEVARLNDVWLDAQQKLEQAEESLARAHEGLKQAGEKKAALADVQREQEALTRLDGFDAQLKTLDTELATLARTVTEREAAVAKAQASLEQARAALQQAQDAHRKANSAEGEAERAVARAALQEEHARKSVERAALAASVDQARAAKAAQDEVAKLEAERKRLETALSAARERQTSQRTEHGLITAVIAYGHWRTATDAARQCDAWKAEAQRLRGDALKKSSEALSVGARAKAIEDEVTQHRSELPDERQRSTLRQVLRELELAEASLGGGVTVMVRPRSTLLLRSTADQGSTEENKVTREHVVEADRRVQLAIGDLVDIEVVAGAPARRRDAELLRKRWKAEGEPALERAGVRNLSELDERFATLDERLGEARQLRAQAAQLSSEAEALQQKARGLDERAASAPGPEQLAARKALVGELPFEVLEAHFSAMGAQWEAETLPLQKQLTEGLAQATAAVTKLETDLQLVQGRLADAKAKVVPAGDVASLQEHLRALDAALAQLAEQLASMEQARGGAVKAAAAQLAQAQQRLSEVERDTAQALEALTAARTAQGAKKGEREGLVAQAPAREPVLARLREATKRLDALASVEVLSDEALAARQRAVAQARAAAEQASRDHHTAAGALSNVGGPQAREDVRALEEALEVARAREHHLEVDGEAWRLLVDAIREAEKEDSSSLGAALAGPITQQFSELTKGRYPSVRFDPSLKTVGLDVPGTQADPGVVLQSLSVGTRDHLATLIRLAIALQLKSAILLDDQLVHSDDARLGWFREALSAAAKETQVVVLTCRPQDYEGAGVHRVDLTKIIHK